MKIAITGHRPNKLGNDYDLTSELIRRIRLEIYDILRNKKATELITGMALGIDTLFAQIAIDYCFPFIAALPCKNQQSKWPERSRITYNKIINDPLCTVKYITDSEYTPRCMQIRNEWMVDNCDLLIAVWNGSTGGTMNCINYAITKNKEIIYINPIKLMLQNKY